MVLGADRLSPQEAAWNLVTASWITHTIRAMVVLGLPEHLAGGSRTITELAEVTGTHAPTLTRLLNALVGLGLCAEGDEGRVGLTLIGEYLRSDVPGTARPFAEGIMAPYVERA